MRNVTSIAKIVVGWVGSPKVIWLQSWLVQPHLRWLLWVTLLVLLRGFIKGNYDLIKILIYKHKAPVVIITDTRVDTWLHVQFASLLGEVRVRTCMELCAWKCNIMDLCLASNESLQILSTHKHIEPAVLTLALVGSAACICVVELGHHLPSHYLN